MIPDASPTVEARFKKDLLEVMDRYMLYLRPWASFDREGTSIKEMGFFITGDETDGFNVSRAKQLGA